MLDYANVKDVIVKNGTLHHFKKLGGERLAPNVPPTPVHLNTFEPAMEPNLTGMSNTFL